MENRQLHKIQDQNQNSFLKCEFFATWRISFQTLNYIITKKSMFQENILNLNIKFMSLITKLDSQVYKGETKLKQYLQI